MLQAPDEDPQGSRMRHALSGAFTPESPTDMNAPTQNDDDLYLSTMKSLTQPGPGMTAYTKHVSQVPKREDYAPSGMDRVAAALSGFGAGLRNPSEGVKVAGDVRDQNFNEAVQQYEMQGKGLGAVANLEENERQNQLALMKAYRDAQLESRRVGATEKTANAAESNANSNKFYRQAMVDDLKTKGWNFHDDDKGHRIATKIGADGVVQKQDLGPSIELEKLSISRTNANANTTRAGAAVTAAGAATTNANANMQRAGQSFQPANQQFYARSLAAQKAVQFNPDWAGFVDSNGQIKTTWRGMSGFAAFTKKVDEFEQEINKLNRVSPSGMGNMPSYIDDGVVDLDQN